MKLTDYRTLGNSGLIVSPLTLGTMTFGQPRWGTDNVASQKIFDSYLNVGGNFIDTADVYANGESEKLVGNFIKVKNARDKVVLGTKFGFNSESGNPNTGGNGRKNIHRAIEGSLKRLRTDYIDIYWLHVWDMVTPVEEVLQTLGDLVHSGKIRYFGLSNMPAWYAAKCSSIASERHVSGPIAQQLYYSLADRTIELEHIPLAKDARQGIVPWSPLAYGFLTGKYKRDDMGNLYSAKGRLDVYNPMPAVNEKQWSMLSIVSDIALEKQCSMAQVALAWVIQQQGISSTLMGVSTIGQLEENIRALDIKFTTEELERLEICSANDTFFPYGIFKAEINKSIFGGNRVLGW